MMRVTDSNRYQKFHQRRDQKTILTRFEFWLCVLLFGSMGAITWAIRGSAGWGGVDGTIVPGLTWGLLWYYLCYRKGIDARAIVLWLGLGIALGGELGYGQYTSWILGKFQVGNETISISPWIGYIWFILCGIGWAAPGGILLGWSLGERVSPSQWIIRSVLLLILLVFLFAWPFVDWLGIQLTRFWPGLLFPHADLGIYTGDLDQHLQRTVYTNSQNFAVVCWWIMALIVAVLQRDRTTLVTGLILGGGFGFGFMQSALWCLGYGFAPDYIDWWKMWELNAGFNLGILYVITLFWALRQVDQTYHPDGIPKIFNKVSASRSFPSVSYQTLFLAVAGSLLIFFAGFEYFFWTTIFLSLFYFLSMVTTTQGMGKKIKLAGNTERRKNILLIYSIFLLVFLLFHGGSERAGIFLELYPEEAVDQYAWPAARIALFAPVAALIVGITLFKMLRIFRPKKIPEEPGLLISKLPSRMVDLMTVIGFIGALSIWPSKIAVLYAFFLFLAIFAFNRLSLRFDDIQ